MLIAKLSLLCVLLNNLCETPQASSESSLFPNRHSSESYNDNSESETSDEDSTEFSYGSSSVSSEESDSSIERVCPEGNALFTYHNEI